MSEKTNHKDSENVFAFNNDLKETYVRDAENGRKKYSCMGCKREVVLVKRESFWHFRHYVKKNSAQPKCTFRDETYRHKIAKEILQREKQIKVPTLYKYPPLNIDDNPKILQSSKTVNAHSVKNEIHFYENNNGELKWGKKEDVKNMNLLIKADSAFFNEKDEPILIIEFVATHKLTDDKKVKIKRLGIDALQVLIPKDSPEAIEESLLKNTSRTKWIYSYEEQNTDYLSLSTMGEDRALEFDEQQRKFFEEGTKCRKARINNLIFTIGRCLESKSYVDTEKAIREELSRLERNTERDRERLQGLQDKLQKELDNKYKEEYRQLEIEQKAFETEEEGFRIQLGDLENRYFTKRDKLEAEESIVKFELSEETKSMGGTGKSFEDRGSEITREKKGIEHDIELEGKRREKLPDKYQQIEEELRIEFEGYEELERPEIERIHAETEKLSRESYEGEISEIGRIGSIIKTIKNENYRGIEKSDFTKLNLGQKHKELFTNGELLHDYEKQKRYFNQLEAARKFLRSGAYKNWV